MATDPGEARHDPEELRRFEVEFTRAHGPLLPVSGCEISWQPSALTPVFYGHRDYGTADGAPANMRVFFPSLDGSPQYGAMLEHCGRYPVILFAHGHCEGDSDQYLKWFRLPAQLARSGYVVVVPQLTDIGSHPSGNVGTQKVLTDALTWIRGTWEFRGSLLPAPATGLAGHSYGALHAGILATKIPVAAVASLSGVWIDWPDAVGPRPIFQGTFPRLFTWGTEPFTERDAILPNSMYSQITMPKHLAVFADGEHFDYLYDPVLPCRGTKGPCRYLGPATDDLVTMFFANYLPPELWPNLPDRVPDSLYPPRLQLTFEQEFFAGGHLNGMQAFTAGSACHVDLSYDLANQRSVPFVRFLPSSLAEQKVSERDLVPRFLTSGGFIPQGTPWVLSQSPAPGARVTAGSEVRMTLRSGPIP